MIGHQNLFWAYLKLIMDEFGRKTCVKTEKALPLQPESERGASRRHSAQSEHQINQLLNKNMNQYETVFILTPVLSDAQMKETVEKFHDFLTQNGAEIINEELWGMRKLAYPIQKKSTGFYTMIEFKANPDLIKKLETAYRRDEKVIRFLTFRNDKYAAEYAEKRRNRRAAQAAEPQVEPAAAAAETTEA